jgi:ABC-type transport system involved in cytochrome bd biosynthesis fused ATPase/permease subunit
MKPDKDRDKSGYEKAVLFECRIARAIAWTLYLVLVAFIIVWVCGFIKISFVQALVIFLGVGWAAAQSARSEYKAEEQLKEIWQADGLDRLVNG